MPNGCPMPSVVPGGAPRTPSKRSRRRRPRQRESASTANQEPLDVLRKYLLDVLRKYLLDVLRKYLPESTKIFEEMLEELI